MPSDDSSNHSLFARANAAIVGGAAGALAYVTWAFFHSRDPLSGALWSLSGPIKWYILIGALLGAVGGLPFAEYLLGREIDDFRWDTGFQAGFVLFVVAITALALWAAST